MDSTELAQILRRCELATAGPWISFVEGRDHFGGDSFIRTGTDREFYIPEATNEDQDFIASAREDVPRLVAEVSRLQREIERLRGVLATRG